MTKMANTKSDDIIVALEEWVNTHSEPDSPIVLIEEGKMISPRQFLEEVKGNTDLGKTLRVSLVQIGVDLIKGIYLPGICP